jgi:hypothetical protein
METNERILSLVREKGPILPVQASKEINENILMTSARLSELLTSKQIKISNLKIGGSPLYYSQGQEHKLQNFTDNLNGVERKAYNLLSQNKILKDSEQEPAIRVALRQIKDFAVPLQVNYKNKIEIFWKWYLVENKEMELLIKNRLSEKKEATSEKKLQKQQERISQEKLLDAPQEEIHKKEEIKKIKKTIDKDLFLKNIHNFFNKSRINIIEKYDIKGNTEIDFLIGIQTLIGNLKYFCKSKNKKKISDADLSSAVIQSQSKNLPLLFLTNGILTKKAQEMLNNEFKNITFKRI